ncbi:MAG: MATE family efflux transporter [Butyrivibrio sp.]|nr:MATE family efflux transporter [Acetatifactor muris]MCM1559819.1 MATE family efflux transporter [Butyrivibrio sp.]
MRRGEMADEGGPAGGNRLGLFVKDKEFYRQTVAIAIPISLQSMVTMGVNLLDNIMVGSLAETVMSGTSLANQYLSLFHICCMGIGMGASVLTARFWGMKKLDDLKRTVTLMLRFCISLAILFTLPAVFAPGQLMRIYTPDADVIAQEVLYYRWIWPSLLLQGLSLTCTIVLRSVGQVKLPLFSSIGAFFVNVFCNYVFIFGKLGAPRMEIRGAALGTLLARAFEFVLICGYFLFRDRKLAYRIKDMRMKCRALLKEYVSVSIPVFVSDALLALGNSAVAMIMGQIGKEFVAANSITMVTQQLSTVMIQGICHAGCIVTGHTLGSGETQKAQKQAWTFLGLGAIAGAVSGLIILAAGKPIISLYNISDETRQIAGQLMQSIALIIVFQCTNSIMMKGVLRGGGDTRFLMVADILFLWVVSIPLGALAGLRWELSAFWIYFFLKLDQVLKAFWCVFRLKSRKWIKVIQGS